jgi:hypothetical protein
MMHSTVNSSCVDDIFHFSFAFLPFFLLMITNDLLHQSAASPLVGGLHFVPLEC